VRPAGEGLGDFPDRASVLKTDAPSLDDLFALSGVWRRWRDEGTVRDI